ncbi:hypothetical protein KI387_000025, partial [Taxus chinensis]
KESISIGLGSKSKPCNKFFSTSGCPYGEDCHYLHYVPGGVISVSQMPKLANTFGIISREALGFAPSLPLPDKSGSVPGYKTRLCNHYGSAEGCPFAGKCHFAHGEKELRKENALPNEVLPPGMGIATTTFGAMSKANPGYKTRLCTHYSSDEGCKYAEKCHFAHGEKELRKECVLPNGDSRPGMGTAAATFGASSKAYISIIASHAGGIIGKDGVNAKQIYRATGVKLTIKDHESDPNLKNIEFEGSFDKINQATAMVRELIMKIELLLSKHSGQALQNLKTRLCEHFAKGTCTFGDKCHFAHGASELQDNSASAAP